MSSETPSDTPHQPNLGKYSGFFAKSLDERRTIINSTDEDSIAALSGELPFDYANKMIENCVGTLSIPVGVCPYLIMNNEHYVVPMATEEPSVIAACSGVTKLVAENGGFTATSTGNIMFTQVQIQFRSVQTNPAGVSCDDYDECLALVYQAVAKLQAVKKDLVAQANDLIPRMVARGGGCLDVQIRVVEPTIYPLIAQQNILETYCNTSTVTIPESQPENKTNLPSICIYFRVNVCDAMGANIVNTVAEGIAPTILSHVFETCTATGAETKYTPMIGLRILSNLCVDRITTACFSIPLAKLQWKTTSGEDVAEGVVNAFYLARDDIFRAVTHNKGVMNGITAVALATGQDTRAIEASVHAYAAIYRQYGYKPITHYWINHKEGTFNGEINVPIAVGTKGGALGQHKLFSWALQQLKHPSSTQLAQILACIGLAQNFAALRALAIEGIQNGHMKLHARKNEQQ